MIFLYFYSSLLGSTGMHGQINRIQSFYRSHPCFSSTVRYLLEFVKWGTIIWLLLPLLEFETRKIREIRVFLGILLFIIFSGKMLYDLIIEGLIKRKNRSMGRDLLSMIGIVLFIALFASLLIGILGFLLAYYIQSQIDNMR